MSEASKRAHRNYYLRHKSVLIERCRVYEKTPKGFLMRKYRNMLSRVRGINGAHKQCWKGKDILPKAEFYEWALASETFWTLWRAYEASGFDRELCPSPDRLNPDEGYQVGNMEWVTTRENSRRGAKNRHKARA